MEFWPADFRADTITSTKKRRKGKELHGANEESTEPGTLGAATLNVGQRHLQWTTLVQPCSENIPGVVGKSLEVFPSTKPPPVNVPRLSLHQRAEQAARFLRTYHPDADFPFELIKDELQSDEEEAVADSALNPYAGNRLVQISLNMKRKQRTHFLAFACGETGADLNVSPFRVTGDKRILFSPTTVPAVSFDTPIQQVTQFSSSSDDHPKVSLLAVRTQSVVSVVKLQGNADVHAESPSLVATIVTSFSTSETGSRRVVDLSCSMLSGYNSQLLLVNDMGAVYNYKSQSSTKTMMVVPNAGGEEDSAADHFWRIARRDTNTLLRTSGKGVHLFDLRARTTPPMELFHVKKEGEYMTSIEASFEERHTMCFATTNNLIWFDERNLKNPVLSINHQRAFDRSLRVETLSFGPSPLTTLSSTANRLVTVYDVNYGPSGHIHWYGEPSIISGSPSLDLPIAGSTFFCHPDEGGQGFGLFQLFSRGSLWKTNIKYPKETVNEIAQGSAQESQHFKWSEDVRALAQKAQATSEDVGPLGDREHVDANLRGIYEKIFQVGPDADETLEQDPEAVYQTLEKMPFFWQDTDRPAEHMLTTFDVAFQSGAEPLHASRADFLTESMLSTPQGFAALPRGRIPISRLVSTARWHNDLSSLPPRMVPGVLDYSQAHVDDLRGEALTQAATPEGMKRATEATQHLALDLALARHVYTLQSFSKPRVGTSGELGDSSLLLEATKAMSLGASEPPPVHFGFLRPVARVPYEEEQKMESGDESGDAELNTPLGVRLLVSQWEVGKNPAEYVYKDPYEEQDVAPPPKKPAPARMVPHPSTQQMSVPSIITVPRPPLVVPSTSRPMATTQGQPPVRTTSMFETHGLPGSSPIRHASSFLPGDMRVTANSQEVHPHTLFSQEQLGPSTQPLPGPFGGGGRQLGGVKKKAMKKRMGGF